MGVLADDVSVFDSICEASLPIITPLFEDGAMPNEAMSP
jgi:hypothetical protein